MIVALAVAVGLTFLIAISLAVQVQGLRRKMEAVPEDGNIVGLLHSLDERTMANSRGVKDLVERVGDLEGRMPFAISYIGVVAYNAFGNITGSRSRSVALLSQRGDGVVITLLAAREETVFFTKEVRGGKGVEELSPEEAAAVDRALGR